jgi:predicted phosphodiesterase
MPRLIVAFFLLMAGRSAPMAQHAAPPKPAQPVAQKPADKQPAPPTEAGSLKFAIIGDSGTGSSAQYAVAKQLIDARSRFPYEFVLMMGDNLYSGSGEKDYRKKFEEPYKPILDAGIKFYAALGNHDNSNERMYKQFNMNGERFYTFKPKPGVRIFALDSNYMDRSQIEWLEKELSASGSDWKVMFFHHPLYSSGETHGSDDKLREQLEPLFLKHGVDVVFAGHEHFYERLKPQKGIYYFISGGAGKLRKGDISKTELTAKAYDTGYHFMLIELAKNSVNFETINQDGKVIDSGALPRFSDADKKKMATSTPTIGPR